MRPYVETRFGVRKLRPSGYLPYATFLLLFFFTATQLRSQCALACKGKINLSLAEYCQAKVYHDQLLTKGIDCPDARFRVDIMDYNMKKIPTSPIITENYIGMTLVGSVYDSTSKNSCWTHILVEEKNAPVILCRRDTVYCNDSAAYNPPVFFDYCDPYPTIKKTSEQHITYPCDPYILKLIVRTWVAQDSRGNISLPCYDSVWLRRAPIDSIEYPKHWIVADHCNVECGSIYPKDADGHPDPTYTGYPTLGGNALWPSFNTYCNLSVTYEDYPIIKGTCKTKILRVWRIVEWWCSTAITRTYQQYIEIADTTPPAIVHCPYDLTVSTTTSYTCASHFTLPEIEAHDLCQDSLFYEIYADGHLISKENGGDVTLDLGDHDVEYRVYDRCYNYSSCRNIITVEDHNPPVAVCQQGTVISLSHSDTVHIYAGVFDDGSHDECHLDSFLVRRMDRGAPCAWNDNVFRPYVEFCCEDVGKTVMVVFRAKDQSGNANDCMVEVEIQDKTPPVVVCPHDYRMPCTDLIDTVNLQRFGQPYYSDNCVVHMHEYVDTAINNCGLGYLQRNFVVEDNMKRRDTCSQRIYVYNPNPFQGDQITWPRDTVIYMCGGDVKPSELPEHYNYPVFRDVHCSLPGHNYDDDVFNYIQDSSLCFKVLRRWTVIDWCQSYYDSATSSVKFATWTHLQIIKVSNKNPPKIADDCDTVTVCLSGTNCVRERVRLSHTASDDCTPDELLRSGFKLDLYNNGLIDSIYNASGNVVSWDGDLPLGTHRFIWVFEDQCGNHIACDQIVRVVNCKIPTAYCLTGIAVNLSAYDADGDGKLDRLVDVWAADVNHGSYQQCGNPITLSFSRDTLDKYRRYTCDSIGQRRVTLWVTDRITGFQDRCITTVTIQDNNKICPGNLTGGTISGLISTPDNRNIPASVLALDQNNQHAEQMTSSRFSFPNLTLGKDYKVSIYNDQEYLMGISTLDIIGIQKHILGKTYFNNVWQYLAADVTNDKKITSADIASLRKLILGIDYKFRNSPSWRYVISNYQFPDPENPWVEDIPESYYYPGVPGDMAYTDFTGVKVGDVSQSSWSAARKAEERTTQQLNMSFTTNGDKSIAMSIDQDYAMHGMQLAIKFNATLNHFTGIQSSGIQLNDYNINTQYANNGLLLISWNTEQPVNLYANQVLMNLDWEEPITREFLTSVEISSDIINAEAYDAGLQIAAIRSQNSVSTGTQSTVIIGGPVPNPFADVTTVWIETRQTSGFKYSISDINGQIIMEQSGQTSPGKNPIRIKGSSMTTPGIYLLRIDVGGINRNFRLVKMEN
ncbi:MAG: T9SS type A sorting domain-containing protein [Saprospiraceae bacterium]|nr:T9SS type A sorting domain-containing protein [Saprospiraceae bacterium]HMX89272.1 T9SS type A sorting domain-containing protein [Saprospiraceae bacterium]HMZ40624.1 T9SS type A sorting domain-containing protein [Saprospiraceae bacterium]HNA63692.1 T9SS type A sorting domain-containing protein [Saprospiraceae bacterium]HNB30995.1 T9SS type A sorting domain-containing protein [Saprospiraceae bacterium]